MASVSKANATYFAALSSVRIQERKKDVEKTGKKVGLRINEIKTKVMMNNTSKMEKN
jgi:hypothetical protein